MVRTNSPILREFAKELSKLGKDDLLACLKRGTRTMDSMKEIAKIVGFDEYPVEGKRIDEYLNKIWPYILEHK